MDDDDHPFKVGQFVWCLFPYDQAPTKPGPEEHVTYIMQTKKRLDGVIVAACAYTTSEKEWKKSDRLPVGVIGFDIKAAQRLGQEKAFLLYTSRIAYIPLNRSFFPRIDSPDHGILLRKSNERFQTFVNNKLAEALKRPELIRLLGPYSPGITKKPGGRGGR